MAEDNATKMLDFEAVEPLWWGDRKFGPGQAESVISMTLAEYSQLAEAARQCLAYITPAARNRFLKEQASLKVSTLEDDIKRKTVDRDREQGQLDLYVARMQARVDSLTTEIENLGLMLQDAQAKEADLAAEKVPAADFAPPADGTDLDSVDLSKDLVATLRDAGLDTVEKVRAATDEELDEIPSVGPATIKTIRAATA